MEQSELLRSTRALCPVCRARVDAGYVRRGQDVFLERNCPEHGLFSVPAWRGSRGFLEWIGDAAPLLPGENASCPEGCGLCADHRRATCCVVLEVTARCNLCCRNCFADPDQSKDPPLAQVEQWFKRLAVRGQTLVQLSGGEPTLRDDLPEIVAAAKSAGCRYVQLNSNGLRLAQDEHFVERLAQAGLSFVFLQFDGMDDAVYEALRGEPLLEIKRRAIDSCARRNIGVALVPMLVPGVNTNQVGEIIRFGAENSPAVRGVHFQPVSYFGRSPVEPAEAPRYTLGELIDDIVLQTNGRITHEDLSPSGCDHPLCGLHGDFVVLPGNELRALSQSRGAKQTAGCCDPAAGSRRFVARRWQRSAAQGIRQVQAAGFDFQNMDVFLDRVRSHGFTVTAMAFQDAATLDIEGLRQCSLHVFADGKMIPFCARYL